MSGAAIMDPSDASSETRGDQESQQEQSRRGALTALIQDFEPIWLVIY